MPIYVKNWHRFQHFSQRRPPWIKLYRSIVDELEWHKLSDTAARHLMMMWLIASEDETMKGRLPDVEQLAFRMRLSVAKLSSILAELSHYLIQDDDNMISRCHQDDTPETETETETENHSSSSSMTATDAFDAFWKAYPRKVGRKAALKAWTKAKDKPGIDAIVLAIAKQLTCDQWTRDNGQYIPHPATWLNQGRWADEHASAPAASRNTVRCPKCGKEKVWQTGQSMECQKCGVRYENIL